MYSVNKYCLQGLSIPNIQFDIDEFLNGLLKYLESGDETGFKLEPYLIATSTDSDLKQQIREKDRTIIDLTEQLADKEKLVQESRYIISEQRGFRIVLDKLLDKPSITFNSK
jgi:hypothetical protein